MAKTSTRKKTPADPVPGKEAKPATTRGQTIKKLGIPYENRHRMHIIRLLAEMYKPAEVATLTIEEFRVEWKILDLETGATDYVRLKQVRLWLVKLIRTYSYTKGREHIQQQIIDLREDIRRDLEEHYRDANKFARIGELSRIKELAVKDGSYMAAVRAMQAIREEIEGTRLRIDGKIDVNHKMITPESEIDAELKKLLQQIGIGSDRADSFIQSLGKAKGTRSDPAQAKPAALES